MRDAEAERALVARPPELQFDFCRLGARKLNGRVGAHPFRRLLHSL